MYWFGSCPGPVLKSVGVFWVRKSDRLSGWLTETQEMELEQREANVDAHFPLGRGTPFPCLDFLTACSGVALGYFYEWPAWHTAKRRYITAITVGRLQQHQSPACRHTRLAPYEGLETLDERHLVERRVVHPFQPALAHLFLCDALQMDHV
jgi:hypothetical protein